MRRRTAGIITGLLLVCSMLGAAIRFDPVKDVAVAFQSGAAGAAGSIASTRASTPSTRANNSESPSMVPNALP